jgi:hypothetical protein
MFPLFGWRTTPFVEYIYERADPQVWFHVLKERFETKFSLVSSSTVTFYLNTSPSDPLTSLLTDSGGKTMTARPTGSINLQFATPTIHEFDTGQHLHFGYKDFLTNATTALDLNGNFSSTIYPYNGSLHSKSDPPDPLVVSAAGDEGIPTEMAEFFELVPSTGLKEEKKLLDIVQYEFDGSADHCLPPSPGKILTVPANMPENTKTLETYPQDFSRLRSNYFKSRNNQTQFAASSVDCTFPQFSYYCYSHPASESSVFQESSPCSEQLLLHLPPLSSISTHSIPLCDDPAQFSCFPQAFDFNFDSEICRNRYSSHISRQVQCRLNTVSDRTEVHFDGASSPPCVPPYRNPLVRCSVLGSGPSSSSSPEEDSSFSPCCLQCYFPSSFPCSDFKNSFVGNDLVS